MRSLLERPITFRLSDAARRRYEQAAAERGMTLSAYLRDRLEIDDQVAEHVSQLRLTLLDGGVGGNPASLYCPFWWKCCCSHGGLPPRETSAPFT